MCEMSTTSVSIGQSWNAHGSSGFVMGLASVPEGSGVPARLLDWPAAVEGLVDVMMTCIC